MTPIATPKSPMIIVNRTSAYPNVAVWHDCGTVLIAHCHPNEDPSDVIEMTPDVCDTLIDAVSLVCSSKVEHVGVNVDKIRVTRIGQAPKFPIAIDISTETEWILVDVALEELLLNALIIAMRGANVWISENRSAEQCNVTIVN